MSQLALQFEAERAHRRLLRAVDDAVAAIGLDVAAGCCDARKQDLCDVLAARDGRHLRSEWVTAIANAAPEEHRRAIANALVNPLGFDAIARKQLSPAEVIDRLTSALRALGPVGIQAMRDALEER